LTKLVSSTLPQASLDDLNENFGEISLSDLVRGHKVESKFNSTSTHTWIELHELAP
jgi:hypothetical protein